MLSGDQAKSVTSPPDIRKPEIRMLLVVVGSVENNSKTPSSNASERWNRKIAKVTAKRYGLKSEKFVIALLNSLWMKEAFFNQAHLSQSFIIEINLPKICQKKLKTANIIEFFKKKAGKHYENRCVNF